MHLLCHLFTNSLSLVRCRQIPPFVFSSVKLFHTTGYLLDRLYTVKHEWIEVEGKVAKIGISNYAQEALGDVVFAELPEIGRVLKKQDECGTLESVKAVSEIYSPVSGKIVEKNEEVEKSPGLINSSCYELGWLFKLELSNDDELKDLMTETQYEHFLKTDSSH